MFGPMDVFGQGRFLIAADPEGAMFGVWQPQAHKGAQLVNENGAFSWNERMTRDIDGVRSFYGSVFGIGFQDLPDTPSSSYQLLTVGENVVGGDFAMPAEVPAEAPPHWLAYFWLDDVDAGFERVRALGGELCAIPSTRPTAATRRCRIRRAARSA